MTLFRLPTSLASAPEVLILTQRATGYRALTVHVFGIAYATEYSTQGDITPPILKVIHGRPSDAKRLCDVGLWQAFDGGWWIRDWLDYQIPADRRPHIPVVIRRAVYERDGWACVNCAATDRLSLDHIIHYSLGGQDTIENLRTLCRSCNSSRKDRTDEEWLRNGP